MKLVKFAAIIPAIVIGILSTSSTSTVKSESVVPSVTRFSTRIETPTICPVVGDGSKANFDVVSADSEVPVYQHCSSCSIGVYAEHADGEVSCTYCGKSNQPLAGE